MNARQKAKKYKRELEELRSMKIEPVYIHHEDVVDVVTLKVDRIVPHSIGIDDYLNRSLRMGLCKELAASEEFEKMVKFTMIADGLTGGIKISAELRVLR